MRPARARRRKKSWRLARRRAISVRGFCALIRKRISNNGNARSYTARENGGKPGDGRRYRIASHDEPFSSGSELASYLLPAYKSWGDVHPPDHFPGADILGKTLVGSFLASRL